MPALIGAALTFIAPEIFGLAVLGTTVGTMVGTVVALGAAFGAQLALAGGRHQQPTLKLAPGPISFEPEIQPVSPRFYSYGRVRLGGIFCFRETDGTSLGYGIILNCRPVDGVEAYFVDDELLSLDTGPVLHQAIGPGGIYVVTTVDEGPTVYWPKSPSMKWTAFISYVWTPAGPMPIIIGSGPAGFLEFINATPDGSASVLLRKYFGAGSPSDVAAGGGNPLWTADHKGQDLAIIYSCWKGFEAASRMQVFPRLFPVHSTAFRGSRIFDPRDATCRFLDPATGAYSVYNSTWKWSANPILQIADFLTFPEGFNLPYDALDWDSFAAEASYCDRLVPTFGGGTEPFAQAHLTWSAEQERRDVLAQLLTACDAQIWEDAYGQIRIWCGKWEEPTVEFTAADVSAFTIEFGNGVYADSNYVTPSYVEPRTNFSKNTSLYYEDTASTALVGQRRSTIDLPAVSSFNQAYRLAARGLKRKNTPMRVNATLKVRGLLADGERVVRLNMPEYGIEGVFRVVAMKAASPALIQMQLHMVTEDMFADEVAPFDPVNGNLSGAAKIVTFTPIQPLAPVLTDTITTGPPLTATISAGVTAPNAMPRNPLIPAVEYEDTTSVARFQSRPVNVSTNAPIGGWSVWTTYVGQYAATSPTISGVAGTHQKFEVQAWFVSPQGVPGPLSPSAFIEIPF